VRNRPQIQPAAVHMKLIVYGPNGTMANGLTDYVSSREIRFTLEDTLPARVGEYVTAFISLPLEITGGHQVSVRINGQVRRVRYVASFGVDLLHFTVSVRNYDLMRRDNLPERVPETNQHLKFFVAFPS
jgi:hypothetical protein